MKQLDRLLFVQGGNCFFCHRLLPSAEASVEHLVASANGGNNADDNCVACCKVLNSLLGSMPLKDKLEVFLRQKGNFKCPSEVRPPKAHEHAIAKPPATLAKASAPTLAPVVKRPTPVPAVAKPPSLLTADPTSTKPSRTVTCPTCKSSVPAAIGQIDYVCARCGAFRY